MFLFWVLSVSLMLAGVGCSGAGEDDPGTETPTASGELESDQSHPSASTTSGAETTVRSEESNGGASGLVRSEQLAFDLDQRTFRTTVVGLGNVRVDADGEIDIRPVPEHGTVSSPDWTYRTRLASIEGTDGTRLEPEQPTSAIQRDGRIELTYASGPIVRYDHRPGGLKQSIRLTDQFAGAEEVELTWSADSELSFEADGDQRLVARLDDRPVFDWTELRVVDADGRRLDASMNLRNGRPVYTVRTADAEFPVEVDPLASSPDETLSENPQTLGLYGQTVSPAGDVDNDDFDDAIVTQISFDASNPTVQGAGRPYLYRGSANGLASAATWGPTGETGRESYGITTSLGDVDGDDNGDVAVSGYKWLGSNGGQRGRVEIFKGKSGAPGLESSPVQTLEGAVPTANDKTRFGFSMAGGDFNCDGTADLAVGSPKYDDGSNDTDHGRVRIFAGSGPAPHFDPSRSVELVGQQADAEFGTSVANAGDVNDDGCDDLIVGQPLYTSQSNNDGRLHVFFGQNGGLDRSSSVNRTRDVKNSLMGKEVVGVGDVNDDGFDDVAVSSIGANRSGPNNDLKGGRVDIYGGAGGGLTSDPIWSDSRKNGEEFGRSIASGDVNGDGAVDLLVGANNATKPNTSKRTGGVFLYLGNPKSGGLTQDPVWDDYASEDGSFFGFSVTIPGDLDAKQGGEDDILIGAPLHTTSGNSDKVGQVFTYYGRPTCLIGGEFYSKDEENPNNACEVCNPSNDRSGWSDAADGKTCKSSNICVTGATCQGGTCQGGTQKKCDDGNSCTENNCDPQAGCQNPDKPAGAACKDDGKSCTANTCDGNGTCTHPIDSGCLINGSCVQKGSGRPSAPCEQCVPSKSKTSFSPVSAGTSCDDGEFCTIDDTCDANGNCAGTFDEETKCKRELSQERVACNTDFRCLENIDNCQALQPEPDGTNCDDGNACTSDATCQAGTCRASPANTIDCKTAPQNEPCKTCDPSTGKCTVDRQDGVDCNSDGDVCTLETCQSGSCQLQGRKMCDDGNPCTEDTCQPGDGCKNLPPEPQGAQCAEAACDDDGNFVPERTCDGMGTCQTANVQDCGPYECSLPNGCPDSCQSEDDCKDGNFCFDRPDDSDGDKECHPNRPPTADAGNDQSGFQEGNTVILNGGDSSDPDDDELNFEWNLVDASCPMGGGPADLSRLQTALSNDANWDRTAERPSFIMPSADCEDEELIFELVVDDGEFDSEPDRATVTYGDCNDSPKANIAGTPSKAEWGETITLDATGSSSGCGASVEDYTWTYEPRDPALQTSNLSGGSQLEVVFPDVCRESGTTYTFTLSVFDGVANSSPYDKDVFVPANGPCQGDGTTPDGGNVDGGSATDTTGVRDLSGGAGCSSSTDQPPAPLALLGVLVLGLKRRRRRDR